MIEDTVKPDASSSAPSPITVSLEAASRPRRPSSCDMESTGADGLTKSISNVENFAKVLKTFSKMLKSFQQPFTPRFLPFAGWAVIFLYFLRSRIYFLLTRGEEKKNPSRPEGKIMKNVKNMSMWDALENIADMMIEEGWGAQAIETAEDTLRRIKSELFEVERFDAKSDLSKAAGDAAWILSKVAMIVAERGFDHEEEEDKLSDLAWDIEEMWTSCGIARIDGLHDTFGPMIDYNEDKSKSMDAAFEELRLEEKFVQDCIDNCLFDEKVRGTVHYVLRKDPMDPEHVVMPFISWASAGAVDVDAAIEFRNALDAAIQAARNCPYAGLSLEEIADDEEEDEDDEDKKVLDEDFCAQFRENVISDEWSKNEAEQLFVQFPDKNIESTVDSEIDDLVDGWGHEQVLEDILAGATEKDPSDWDAEFAFDKILSLGVAYYRVTEGDPRRLDKHDMFRRWAAVIGSEITEEELTDKDPGGRGVLEYAAGYIKGIEVEVTYRRYDK